MKRYLGFFLALAMYSHVGSLSAQGEPPITWLDNYETAVNMAKSQSKPLLLFFTGSDWCGYCQKLKKEVLNNPEIVKNIRNKFIFLTVDFPQGFSLPGSIAAQNEQLKAKFNVRGFPMVILYDAQRMRQMGEAIDGYQPPQAFLNSLERITNQYSAYMQKMQQLDSNQFASLSGLELKHLYEKAAVMHFDNDAHRIMRVGLESDQTPFFQVEKYRFLALEGRLYDQETKLLKEAILAADPDNLHKMHYEIAMIDYDAIRAGSENERFCPERAVAPLLSYISRFGAADRENVWRLEMIISEAFLECDEFRMALKHAEESRRVAPPNVQPAISIAIKNIESVFTQPLASGLN